MNTVGYGFFSSYDNPGMVQSSAVAVDVFSSFHFGMDKLQDRIGRDKFWKYLVVDIATGLGDYLLCKIPGGDGWVHEEFHRSIMSRFGVNSFDMVYTFPIFSSTVSVNHVSDEDLERFKAESPADFIRMHAAGIEGTYVLIDKLQQNNFLYRQEYFNEALYWFGLVAEVPYVIGAALPLSDSMASDSNDIAERDFTGNDVRAWVYDLFRPEEPYSARGIHSSGVGFKRNINTADLTNEETAYLKKQGWWQIANFASPMLYGFRSLPLGDTDIRWNFAFRYNLTSFGTDFSLITLWNIKQFNIVGKIHNYMNYEHYFPAIEIALIDFPITFTPKFGLLISPCIMIGMQPSDQNFKTSSPEFFGLLSCRVDFNVSKHFLPYFEFKMKTDGWVSGDEYLNKNVSGIIGLSVRI
ncbi:hypothetical protein FACS189494_02730 [Spirochaetia bacterium]|nr:hypothetical protein FACS189494_02730 [Spirochaetia bacterium]